MAICEVDDYWFPAVNLLTNMTCTSIVNQFVDSQVIVLIHIFSIIMDYAILAHIITAIITYEIAFTFFAYLVGILANGAHLSHDTLYC